MSVNEWEERARATKAYRIARVLRHAEEVPTDDWRDATESDRERVAELADVKTPSAATWEMAVDILGAMRQEGAEP